MGRISLSSFIKHCKWVGLVEHNVSCIIATAVRETARETAKSSLAHNIFTRAIISTTVQYENGDCVEMGRRKPVRVGMVGREGRREGRREGEVVHHGSQVPVSFSWYLEI